MPVQGLAVKEALQPTNPRWWSASGATDVAEGAHELLSDSMPTRQTRAAFQQHRAERLHPDTQHKPLRWG